MLPAVGSLLGPRSYNSTDLVLESGEKYLRVDMKPYI